LKPARQTRYIIDDDHGALGPALADEGQHSLHAGALRQAPRHIIGKYINDLIALHPGEIPAPRFLGLKAISHGLLLDAGNPAVNDCLARLLIADGASFPVRADGISCFADGIVLASGPGASEVSYSSGTICPPILTDGPISTNERIVPKRVL